jgi:hypothetical protein
MATGPTPIRKPASRTGSQQSVFGSKFIDSLEPEGIEQQIRRAKWLVWHGKAGKTAA